MYDILIKNGKVVNGMNEVPYIADIAICGDTIVKIGKIDEPAGKVINADGKLVTPGFIDVHCHSDYATFIEGKNQKRIQNGVTTEVIGNCGISAAPVNPATSGFLKDYIRPALGGISAPFTWVSMGDYLDVIEKNKPLLNTAALVGHGTLRIAVVGFEHRALTKEEQDKMNGLLREAMDDGVYGISTGLIYPPGVFADSKEIIELAKVAAEYDGIYTTHMRNESEEIIGAVTEAIEVARRSGINLQISHHKVSGVRNKNKSVKTLEMLHKANDEGLNVNCDVYPYTSGSTVAAAYLPPWVHAGGKEKVLGRLENEELRAKMIREIKENTDFDNFYLCTGSWEKMLICQCAVKEYQGKTIQKIAEERNRDPFEMALDIIKDSRGDAFMIAFAFDEMDVSRIIHDPLSMFCSDGVLSLGPSHPRYIGSFVRGIEKYVKQDKILSLPEAIYKMSGLPAKKFGFNDRGHIAEGLKADILIMDLDKLHDNSDFINYDAVCSGMEHVIINGEIAVDEGKYQKNVCAGRVLRRK